MGFKARQTEMARDREYAKGMGIRVGIYREMKEAYLRGESWTAYRKFKYPGEIVGAVRCGANGCRQRSEYVSYCIGIKGRTVLCEKHYAERNH